MAKTRKCPVCGIPVKVENLEKHLRKVHPHEKIEIELSEEEREEVGKKKAVERRISRRGERLTFAIIAIIVAIIVLVALLYQPQPEGWLGKEVSFTTTDIDGNPIRVPRDYLGEIIVIVFFQTGCSHCRDFEPILNRIYENYSSGKPKPVNMISVDISPYDKENDVRNFMQEFGSEWTFVLDSDGTVVGEWERVGPPIQGTPTTFLVDVSGGTAKIEFGQSGTLPYSVLANELDNLMST